MEHVPFDVLNSRYGGYIRFHVKAGTYCNMRALIYPFFALLAVVDVLHRVPVCGLGERRDFGDAAIELNKGLKGKSIHIGFEVIYVLG